LSVGPLKEMTSVADGLEGLIDHFGGATALRPSIHSTLAAGTSPQKNTVTRTAIAILSFIVLPFPKDWSIRELSAYIRFDDMPHARILSPSTGGVGFSEIPACRRRP
jgi:hypothetical protein